MKPDQEPLAQLHGLHLPEAISWWPPAPGWWLLAVLILGAIAFLIWRHLSKRHDAPAISLQAMLSAALIEIEGIRQSSETASPAQTATALSSVLKRMAMHMADDASNPATLTGQAWLAWLDQRWSREDFTHGDGNLLADAAYRPDVAVDVSSLIDVCQQWLETQLRVVSPS